MEQSKTVLVIEDHPVVLEGVIHLLEVKGLRPIGAPTGIEGLELAERHHPDAIICNFSMPGLDGLGVLQRLRANARTSDIPFILISANIPESAKEACEQMGADAVVLKASGAAGLLEALDQVLKQTSDELH